MPSIGTDDLHPPMPSMPREYPGPDTIPYRGGVCVPPSALTLHPHGKSTSNG